MSTRIYVGNLSFNTSQEALSSAFSRFGEVREVKIVTDRETGQSRGFAFVTMAEPNGARAAIAQMNGSMMDGRSLRVNEAEERQQRNFGRQAQGGGGSRW